MSETPNKIVAGVLAAERIVAGLVTDGQMNDGVQHFPPPEDSDAALTSMPADAVITVICDQIRTLCHARGIEVASLAGIGIGFPGIIKDGIVEESPNLPQMKGCSLSSAIRGGLEMHAAPVVISNDADALAAGIASIHGHLEKLVRVWTLGRGVGFGTYPAVPGVWEGGHMVVSLDAKEHFCGCGGAGHLEGIMGTRAMRKRFLDMEPDEVFGNAKRGTLAAQSLSTYGIAHWRPGPRTAFTSAAPAASLSPDPMRGSSMSSCLAATFTRWSR